MHLSTNLSQPEVTLLSVITLSLNIGLYRVTDITGENRVRVYMVDSLFILPCPVPTLQGVD